MTQSIRPGPEGISLSEIQAIADSQFGELVKAVVDVENKTMLLGAELHSDEEAELLQEGSSQEHLWGINLYPSRYGSEDWIEFDSMINLRPSQSNRSRSVEDAGIRKRIAQIVGSLVRP